MTLNILIYIDFIGFCNFFSPKNTILEGFFFKRLTTSFAFLTITSSPYNRLPTSMVPSPDGTGYLVRLVPAVWIAAALGPQIAAPSFSLERTAAGTSPGALRARSREFGPLTGQSGHGRGGRGMVVVSMLWFMLPAARAGRLAPSAISHAAVHLHTAALLLAQVSCHPECALLSSSRPVSFTSLSLRLCSGAGGSSRGRSCGERHSSERYLSSVLSTVRGLCVCVCAPERERGREKAGYL